MPRPSSPDLLVLHALRLSGMATEAAVAARFRLDRELVEQALLDHEAAGRVQRVAFADLGGWTLTETGHAEHRRLLDRELDETGARPLVDAVHARFVALNGRFLSVVTDWQIHPSPGDPLAANDHRDWRWDERVLGDLRSLLRAVRPLCSELQAALDRFEGYPERLGHALDRVDAGERSWVDSPRPDSFHGTWFELHEDLLATLGIARGAAEAS